MKPILARVAKARPPLQCENCGHTWTPRKKVYAPRQRCPACFRAIEVK